VRLAGLVLVGAALSGCARSDRRDFVDCARVGHVRSATDPAGDTYSLGQVPVNGQPPRVVGPRADVTAVAVARSPSQVCLDLTLKAAPAATTKISFLARPRAPSPRTSETLAATMTLPVADAPTITVLDHGTVAARVGTSQARVSLVIAATSLPESMRYLFHRPFDVQVVTDYQPAGAGQDSRVNDDAPDGAWFRYG
jgi:hypothetical protein